MSGWAKFGVTRVPVDELEPGMLGMWALIVEPDWKDKFGRVKKVTMFEENGVRAVRIYLEHSKIKFMDIVRENQYFFVDKEDLVSAMALETRREKKRARRKKAKSETEEDEG